jgi:orotate phosphoribosyltransferase
LPWRRSRGFEICGVMAILDRLAGGADAIRAAVGAAPYNALTTIDDVYPERPDR